MAASYIKFYRIWPQPVFPVCLLTTIAKAAYSLSLCYLPGASVPTWHGLLVSLQLFLSDSSLKSISAQLTSGFAVK